MEPIRVVTGRALPLGRANVDTDQIIPSHWLKRIERTGYGLGLFEAWRKDPSFVLNDGRYRGANILIAGANFGCGSSREHAVWALQESGFRAVIAPTVAAPGVNASFPLADYLQTQLLEGLDEIALTLRHEPDIAAFESKRSEWLP